ncbi:unnamed protein product [Polarella glacialis]|uniref:U-box domain-containing protein n=1 Tax=Polarella glacialis TaxID=89957 RepID=A0A813F6N1_POLGL|nr:unnamed protein product [Polarella glacialis]
MANLAADEPAPGADLTVPADVIALIGIGVSLIKLEELYGCDLVRDSALSFVKGESHGRRLEVGAALLERSISLKAAALSDEAFVQSLLASLEEDPEEMLMDPLMMVPLKDPCVLSSGFVLDRETVLDEQGRVRISQCPFSRQPLLDYVYPLHFLRERVKEWKLQRLDRAVSIVADFLEQKNQGAAERVFVIAERFLDEVGDATYVHRANRLSELEQKLDMPKSPSRALRSYRRSASVLGEADKAALVCKAVQEFLTEAKDCLAAGDPHGANAWLGQDILEWLHSATVQPHWKSLVLEFLRTMLRLSRETGGDAGCRRGWWAALFKQLGLAAWLREEAGEEPELRGVDIWDGNWLIRWIDGGSAEITVCAGSFVVFEENYHLDTTSMPTQFFWGDGTVQRARSLRQNVITWVTSHPDPTLRTIEWVREGVPDLGTWYLH